MFSFLKILIISISFLSNIHPVHVSIASMDYAENEKEINLSFRVFKDDFQLLFVHLNQKNIDFDDDKSYMKNKILLDNYFNTHFQIFNGNNKLKLTNTNYKKRDDTLWFYYKISVMDSLGKCKITNTILFDLFMDQTNLMILKYNDKEKGYKFTFHENEFTIDFNEF